MQKYGFDEARPVLERASARETAARVALGAIARSFVKEVAGIEIVSHVVELAAVKAPDGVYPLPGDVERLDADPVRCLDADASKAMAAAIDQAHADGDTLGGVVEVLAHGVPVGLGSHVHWDRRLDARLAAALMGIQAIKGWRSATASTWPACRAPGRTTRSCPPPGASGGPRAARAVPRAV